MVDYWDDGYLFVVLTQQHLAYLTRAPSCGGSRASKFSSDPARDGLRATAGLLFVNDTREPDRD